jgi:hypothetical protein
MFVVFSLGFENKFLNYDGGVKKRTFTNLSSLGGI